MLLQELLSIINESVTFSAAVLEDDPEYGKTYNSAKFQKEVELEHPLEGFCALLG